MGRNNWKNEQIGMTYIFVFFFLEKFFKLK